MLPEADHLLSEQQIRDASTEQIEDLVQSINIELQKRGRAGLVWRSEPDDGADVPQGPADPRTDTR